MAGSNSVWGIDIGQCALKALKLNNDQGQLTVEAIEIIEHSAILSRSDAVNQQEIIRATLETFLARNKLSGSSVAIAVPGQSSFTRFVKLPPVEDKRVPDIVRFEAEQQIPFPIEEVIWRWQTFHDPDSPDVEVGIFAMKRLDIDHSLDHFRQVGIDVDMVQMAPLALYNFMCFDEQVAKDGASMLIDVGTDKTDLVIADGPRLWTRTIQIGGSNFTEALVKAFKLSFEKAEKLKRSAATSKYARQVFQSMRPVFSDLVQEIQRSIGYYTSLHRQTKFKHLIGMGNGFRLPGLQRFIEQNLNVSVVRIDSYNQVALSPEVKVPVFTENILSFAVAYGTAIQAMDKGKIGTNLLPVEIVRRRMWARKRPWLVTAAAILILALACRPYRAYNDRQILSNSSVFNSAKSVTSDMRKLHDAYGKLKNKGKAESGQIKWYLNLFAHRGLIPSVQGLISESIKQVAADQHKLVTYTRDLKLLMRAKGKLKHLENSKASPELIKQARDEIEPISQRVKAFKDLPRNKRQVIIIDDAVITYLGDITKAMAEETTGSEGRTTARRTTPSPEMFGPGGMPTGRARASRTSARRTEVKTKRGFKVEITGRTPLQRGQANDMLSALRRKSGDLAKNFRAIDFEKLAFTYLSATDSGTTTLRRRTTVTPTMMPGGEGMLRPHRPRRTVAGTAGTETTTTKIIQVPDPTFPDEDMIDDTRFSITLILSINDSELGPQDSSATDGD